MKNAVNVSFNVKLRKMKLFSRRYVRVLMWTIVILQKSLPYSILIISLSGVPYLELPLSS